MFVILNKSDMQFTYYTTNYKRGADLLQKTQYTGNNVKSMHVSVEASLKKLRTNYIDILYVHWWDWSTSIEEMMDSLDAVVKQGKVLYLGISDTPAYIVSAANAYAKANGKTQFSIYQGRYVNRATREHLLVKRMLTSVLQMEHHVSLTADPGLDTNQTFSDTNAYIQVERYGA